MCPNMRQGDVKTSRRPLLMGFGHLAFFYYITPSLAGSDFIWAYAYARNSLLFFFNIILLLIWAYSNAMLVVQEVKAGT